MKLKCLSNALIAVTGLVSVATGWAQTYQFEGSVTAGQTKFENTAGAELSEDLLIGTFRYFLRPIASTDGPLAERAFIDKAAFVGARFYQLKAETGFTADVLSPQVRLVTQSNLIVEAIYSQVKADGAEDRSEYSVGVGKYLDDRSEAVLTYSVPNDDRNIITGRFKTLRPASGQNKFMGFEAKLGYLNSELDTGYQLELDGTYYFSNVLSAGAGLQYLKISDFDETAFKLRGQYFISDKLFGNVDVLSASNTSDISATRFSIGFGGRF